MIPMPNMMLDVPSSTRVSCCCSESVGNTSQTAGVALPISRPNVHTCLTVLRFCSTGDIAAHRLMDMLEPVLELWNCLGSTSQVQQGGQMRIAYILDDGSADLFTVVPMAISAAGFDATDTEKCLGVGCKLSLSKCYEELSRFLTTEERDRKSVV